jgi:4-alpha-glucanotransferase
LGLVPYFVHFSPANERINVPGKVEETNWSYRIVPNLEDFVNNETLNTALARIIAK